MRRVADALQEIQGRIPSGSDGMHSSTCTELKKRNGTQRMLRLTALLAGGILLQTAASGCEQYLSNAVSALGNPIATGIGNGISNALQALVVGLLI